MLNRAVPLHPCPAAGPVRPLRSGPARRMESLLSQPVPSGLRHWAPVNEAFYKYVVEPNKGKDFVGLAKKEAQPA